MMFDVRLPILAAEALEARPRPRKLRRDKIFLLFLLLRGLIPGPNSYPIYDGFVSNLAAPLTFSDLSLLPQLPSAPRILEK